MANVSQQTRTFLGGVSRKADFDKMSGQLVEAKNVYPDETYGMVKRPGTEFIGNLGIGYAEAQNTYFFPIIREGRPLYLCGLKNQSIKVWDLDDPTRAITVNTPNGKNYLTYNNINSIIESQAYRATSDDRRTVIVNRTVTCLENTTEWENASPGFVWTNRIKNRDSNSIEDLPDGRVVRIHVTDGGFDFPEDFRPLRPGIHYLPVSVDTEDPQGNPINTEGFGCVIKCTVNDAGKISPDEYDKCELWSAGSGYPDQSPASIDGIPNSRVTLATGLQPGEVYRVVNSGADKDDFYMQPFSNTSEADDDPGIVPGNRARIDGPYFLEGMPSPNSYVGLNAATLPHELIDNLDGTFTFRIVDYSNRWSGDNVNNPAPSFINHLINNAFFLNNRLGFLCEDNVILSRPINYGPPGAQDTEYVPEDNPWVLRNYTEIDFFRQSAIGMTAADPIDMKAANNNTSIFHTIISTPQGVILFADGQQSLLYQPEGLLSPLTASINSLSNYDMTGDVNAVIVGETYYFINKSQKFCRIYSMVNQGMQNPPVIEDVTKEIADWLPNDITDLVECPTDSMIFAFNRTRDTVYCRRTIGDGSSWVKWTHAAPILNLVVDHDLIYFINRTNDNETTISKARLYVLPDDYSLNQRNELEQPEEPQVLSTETESSCSEIVQGYGHLYSFIPNSICSQYPETDFEGNPARPCGQWARTSPSNSADPSIWKFEIPEDSEVTSEFNRSEWVRSMLIWKYDVNGYAQEPETVSMFTGVGVGNFQKELAEQAIFKLVPDVGTCKPTDPDPPTECCNLCIQKTDGTTLYTSIVSNEWFLTTDRDDTVINYRDCTVADFDPNEYDYYRYIGQLNNPEYPEYEPGNYGRNIGLYIDTTGKIITNWREVLSDRAPYVGGPTFPGNWYGGSVTHLPGWVLNEDYGQGPGEWVDEDGNTTSWTVEKPWGANMEVSTTGFENGGLGFVGSMGLFINGEQTKCNPGAQSGGAFAPPPFRMAMSVDEGELRTVTITGYWEFTKSSGYPQGDTEITSWSGLTGYDPNSPTWKTYRIPTAEFVSVGCCQTPTPKLDTLILDPYLDHFTDQATVSGNVITPPAGYPNLPDAEPCYLLGTLPGKEPIFTDRSGQTATLTWQEDGTLLCDRDLTGYQDVLIIGYRFNYQLILPNLYFSLQDGTYDYTASLTISRTKFTLGFSGNADFEILTKNAPNPIKAYTQIISNDYLASTAPLGEPTVVAVPIHKRNTDFRIQISSESPFPLSVDSCMWEGNYSPRYYRRM